MADTWGGDEETLNSMYPAIAPYGKDSSDESFMIVYQRTGPTIFPELCVINFDSSWGPGETVVKQGQGIIDLFPEIAAPWDEDSLERIGDYISIQRRYGDPNRACWLAGSFAWGPIANHFGVTDGIGTWIAEVGDTTILSTPDPRTPKQFVLFPNPLYQESQNLMVQLPYPF